MSKYTEAVKWDGAVVLDEGELMPVEAIVETLNRLIAARDAVAHRLEAMVEHGEILSTTDTIMVSKSDIHAVVAMLREGAG